MPEVRHAIEVNSLRELIFLNTQIDEINRKMTGDEDMNFFAWKRIEEEIMSSIDTEKMKLIEPNGPEALLHYVRRYQKQSRVKPVHRLAIVMYEGDRPRSIFVDLVDVARISHPVLNYKKVPSQLTLTSVPLMKIDDSGRHYLLSQRRQIATYSGLKTGLIPLKHF